MKKLLPSIALIAVFIFAGIISSNFTDRANAESDGEKHSYIHKFTNHKWSDSDHEGKKDYEWKNKSEDNSKLGFYGEDVSRKVEIIENGITIEITSSDSETIARIQEFATNEDGKGGHKRWGSSSITKNTEIIDGGVKTTITSDDPDKVTLLQEKLGSGSKFLGFRKHHQGYLK